MTSMAAMAPDRPVRVEAVLDAPLSRWLWLVKWVLLIPHYIVLFVIAAVIGAFTEKYPKDLST
jgi:hypothetical protein